MSLYNGAELDKTPANFSPLTPLSALARTERVHPELPAVVYGRTRRSWGEVAVRCRRLAAALSQRGVTKGDTVALIAPNIPEALECALAVPMLGAVLNANNVRIQWIGRPFNEPGSKTPGFIQKAILQAIEDTAHNTGMVLTVAFDYGSRAELLRAAQLSRASHHTAQDVLVQEISDQMYAPNLPPVDVVVRTSGESRISNFMLWQIKGAKVYFTERTWPDFDAHEIDNALKLVHAR